VSDPSFVPLLAALNEHGVEYFVVGALAAVLQGAPVVTFDVDIVHRRTPDNVERLLGALRALDAYYRLDPRKLRPNETHLVTKGHQLLQTRQSVKCSVEFSLPRSSSFIEVDVIDPRCAGGGSTEWWFQVGCAKN
jgi:hypothetical protein